MPSFSKEQQEVPLTPRGAAEIVYDAVVPSGLKKVADVFGTRMVISGVDRIALRPVISRVSNGWDFIDSLTGVHKFVKEVRANCTGEDPIDAVFASLTPEQVAELIEKNKDKFQVVKSSKAEGSSEPEGEPTNLRSGPGSKLGHGSDGMHAALAGDDASTRAPSRRASADVNDNYTPLFAGPDNRLASGENWEYPLSAAEERARSTMTLAFQQNQSILEKREMKKQLQLQTDQLNLKTYQTQRLFEKLQMSNDMAIAGPGAAREVRRLPANEAPM